MDQIIAGAIILAFWVLGIIVGRCSMAKYKNRETIGTLQIYTGDPDGVYMALKTYVIPEYIMTQKEVTLSVDVTDVSQN